LGPAFAEILLLRRSRRAPPQQIAVSFRVQVDDGGADGGIQGVNIGKGLVGEIEGFEVVPPRYR
jgi:hypothetical protein